jgi:hypothetical protein
LASTAPAGRLHDESDGAKTKSKRRDADAKRLLLRI